MVTKHVKKLIPKWKVGLGSSLLGILVFLAGMYGLYAFAYADEIFPNTLIGSLAVGGLTTDDAQSLVTDQVRSFEESALDFAVADTAVTLDPKNLDVSYNVSASVQQAYDRGRSGGFWQNLVGQLTAAFSPTTVPFVVDYDTEALDSYLDGLITRFDDPEQNAGVRYDEGELTIIEPHSGERFDHDRMRSTIVHAIETATVPIELSSFPLRPVEPLVTQSHVQQLLPVITSVVSEDLTLTFEEASFTVTPDQLTEWIMVEPVAGSEANLALIESGTTAVVSFSSDEIAAYAKTLADELAQDPIDAKLTIRGGKATVFRAARDGIALDQDATVSMVIEQLRQRRQQARSGKPVAEIMIELPVEVTKPTVTSSTVDDLGIKELIGTATTDFSGSPDNRVHNIGNGTKFLNGWLVKPGEEFSTVKALGAVDGSTGYLPELVIKENRTIPEYGGGLCQVSTTLFRSVLDAGLPVTERRQHSYRVGYYERGIGPGLDATIYLPKPDFRFKNDTDGWILVQGSVTGLKVTFELYGTSDGRTSSIDGPHTLSTTPAPPSIYEETDQLAPGEQEQIEKAHDGATTIATYTVKRGGKVIHEQTFKSKYKALPARYLEGPKTDNSGDESADTADSGDESEGEVAGAQDDTSADEAENISPNEQTEDSGDSSGKIE